MTRSRQRWPHVAFGPAIGMLVWLTASATGAEASREAEVTAVSPRPEGASSVHLGGSIMVTISNLDVLLKDVQMDKNKIVLYLNDQMIPEAHPTAINLAEGRLTFDLKRTDASKAAWAEVLYPPWKPTREVQVGVGTATGTIKHNPDATFQLTVIATDWSLWAIAAVFLFACVMFGWLARESNMLRDAGEEPVDPDAQLPRRKPFSLARTQMAFWFFIVLASYLLIFAVTRERDTIPPEVLGLLGISASTALGAVLIDSSKDAAAKVELDSAKRELSALSAKVAAAETAATPNQAEIQALKEQRRNLYGKIAPASEGFVLDLLSDANGISLNRFQMGCNRSVP